MTQINPWMCPEGAQVELYRERCLSKVLKLSIEVSECEPLPSVSENEAYARDECDECVTSSTSTSSPSSSASSGS